MRAARWGGEIGGSPGRRACWLVGKESLLDPARDLRCDHGGSGGAGRGGRQAGTVHGRTASRFAGPYAAGGGAQPSPANAEGSIRCLL